MLDDGEIDGLHYVARNSIEER